MHAQERGNKEESFVVLLATSDPRVSEELHRTLHQKKVEILTFDNAKDMLFAIAENRINLIVFDPDISELKGISILSVIKKFRPGTRVIAMGENLSFETQRALANEGVLYQIPKPMSPDQISQVVETVVDKLYPHN